MKRKYEVVSTIVKRHALVVTVQVHEIGPAWGFEVVVPWEMIDQREAYEAAELEAERRWRYRMLDEEQDSLFG